MKFVDNSRRGGGHGSNLFLPPPLKWRVFFSRQERNPAYLQAGDVITASIASQDGVLDLGTQRTVVRDRPS
jgi:hypothetical protein